MAHRVTDPVFDTTTAAAMSSSSAPPSSSSDQSSWNAKNGGFCIGPGYAMESGFQPGFGPTNYCVLLLFSSWNINTESKYAATLVFAFFLGFLIESGSFVRKKLSARIVAGGSTSSSNGGNRKNMKEPVNPLIHYSSCLLYGLQMTLAYFAMLVVMLYETYIFACLIGGLVFGHGLFSVFLPRREMFSHQKKEADKRRRAAAAAAAIAAGGGGGTSTHSITLPGDELLDDGGEDDEEGQTSMGDDCACSAHSPCCSAGLSEAPASSSYQTNVTFSRSINNSDESTTTTSSSSRKANTTAVTTTVGGGGSKRITSQTPLLSGGGGARMTSSSSSSRTE